VRYGFVGGVTGEFSPVVVMLDGGQRRRGRHNTLRARSTSATSLASGTDMLCASGTLSSICGGRPRPGTGLRRRGAYIGTGVRDASEGWTIAGDR
jgi:hypothetical protein